MPEFLRLLPPAEARSLLLSNISPSAASEEVDTSTCLLRVAAEDVIAPHPLPEFSRSSVDGYAVRAEDTYGATDSMPAYLRCIGEVAMGSKPTADLHVGECAVIHTGGMLPVGADAVAMLEHAQVTPEVGNPSDRDRVPVRQGDATVASEATMPTEIEILRAVAPGENVVEVGEDVHRGQVVIERGALLRPAEIGGLMALGVTSVRVVRRPRVALVSSGDEVVEPLQQPAPGQVRDVNTFTLASLVAEFGGEPHQYGIVRDDLAAVKKVTAAALAVSDMLLISGGSSAGIRDLTAEAIDALGAPGVLVHGVNIRPGKPTILAACEGKAVIGLPGNPVSALVIGYLFVVPVIERLLGLPEKRARPQLPARLLVNLPSQAGREDWWPVRLRQQSDAGEEWIAQPIFGKSNLIFSLAAAHGLIRIPPEANGLAAGETVNVWLI